ncbi:GDYXXLXY domain-containing protein, partial [Brucella abortus]
MTTNRKWLYAGAVLAALLQTGILYAGIEKRAAILRSGQDIVFQTEPVDPRDLMRGDYVVLGYEISNIARSAIQGVRPAGSRTVYVAVK